MFYIDIRKSLDPSVNREEAIIGVPIDRIIRKDFGRVVDLDVSSAEREYDKLTFPASKVFDGFAWVMGFLNHWGGDQHASIRKMVGDDFRLHVLESFTNYQVPVITLDKSTSREAVCVVFTKVNTGGKDLDVFELVTATYAADGHLLREDWYGDIQQKKQGRHQRFSETLRPAGAKAGIIADVSSTGFLQAISLFYTRDQRRKAEKDGKQDMQPRGAAESSAGRIPAIRGASGAGLRAGSEVLAHAVHLSYL